MPDINVNVDANTLIEQLSTKGNASIGLSIVAIFLAVVSIVLLIKLFLYIKTYFKKHDESFRKVTSTLEKLEDVPSQLRNNTDKLGRIETDIAVMKNDISWLKATYINKKEFENT
jgi:uncharacterized protein YoxC